MAFITAIINALSGGMPIILLPAITITLLSLIRFTSVVSDVYRCLIITMPVFITFFLPCLFLPVIFLPIPGDLYCYLYYCRAYDPYNVCYHRLSPFPAVSGLCYAIFPLP